MRAVDWYRQAGDAGLAGVGEHLNRLVPSLVWLAKTGNLRAATLLAGLANWSGDGRAQSIGLLQAPAAAGDAQAQRLLGFLLSQDENDDSGQARALELFRSAAEAGDGYAALNLSRSYAHGHAVAADGVEAVRWARVAVEAGLIQGYGELGDRLSALGRDEEALAWYVKGAQAGDLDCCFAAACWFRDGWGTPIDRVQSLRWFLALFGTDQMGQALHAAHELITQMSQTEVYRAGSQARQPLAAVNLWQTYQTPHP